MEMERRKERKVKKKNKKKNSSQSQESLCRDAKLPFPSFPRVSSLNPAMGLQTAKPRSEASRAVTWGSGFFGNQR